MTSLLGRLLRLFPESVPLEDLFTKALARLFETRPDVCIAWLEEVGVLASGGVRRARSLTGLLQNDHTAAVKQFFVESVRQLSEELAAFKEKRPDLVWNGG